MELIYLDWAATTPVSNDVLQEIVRVFKDYPGNPSSMHLEGKKAAVLLEEDRKGCAELLGVLPEHIHFTSGGTESNSIILNSLLLRESRGRIIISEIEHPSIFEYITLLKKIGYDVSIVKPDKTGMITPEAVRSKLTKDTFLVTVMTVNNETGIIQPIKSIAGVIRDFEKENGRPIHFHTDAVQALGKIHINLKELDVDSASFSAHKIQGPRGSGILYSRKRPAPLSKGGGQESGVRAGTENLPGIHGLYHALKAAVLKLDEHVSHAEFLRDILVSNFHEIPGIDLNFTSDSQSPFIINARSDKFPSEVLTRIMSDRGFALSPGSACSSKSKGRKSRILTSAGLSEKEAFHSFRISTGFLTTREEIEALCQTVREVLSK